MSNSDQEPTGSFVLYGTTMDEFAVILGLRKPAESRPAEKKEP